MTAGPVWPRVRLDALVKPSKRRVDPADVPPETPYLSLEHVEPRTGRILGHGSASDVRSTKTAFGAGDVLYGRLRPYLNKVCRPDFGGICSTEFLVFSPPTDIEGEYLRQVLGQRSVVQLASHAATGDLPRVSFSDLADLEVTVPPKHVQARVASAADATRVRSTSALRRLDRARVLCVATRREILLRAFRGDATADWRAASGLGRAMVDAVLASIEVERQATAVTRKEKENAALRAVDAAELPELPDSWRWVALPDTGQMGRGRSKHRPRNDPKLYGGPYPFIQTGDVRRSGGLITEFHQTYNDAGLAQSRLWPSGTVCITIAANIAATGVLTFEAAFPDSVVGVVPHSKLVTSEYLELFLRTARSDLERFAPATAQKNINLAILNDVAVPVPPLEEQEELVERVRRDLESLARAEQHASSAERRLEAVDGAVLATALRSENGTEDRSKNDIHR